MIRRVLSFVCLGAIVLLNSGCGDSAEGGKDVKLAEGSGIVKYNGSPLGGASVTFIPKNGPIATGTTDPNGKFKLTTGALPGVATGVCKVTVIAVEGGGKPAVTDTLAMPTTRPANPEEMRKQMAAMGPQMQSSDEASKPKSIIPEIYGNPTTTTLTYTVDSDASKNQFTIDLKD